MTTTRATRALVLALAAVLLVDVVGGVLAVAAGVNTWGEAWGSRALLAAPLPMVLAQVVGTALAVAGRGRRAVLPAALLALACLVSVVSGFFDGGLGHAGLSGPLVGFQALLLAVTALLGGCAAVRGAQLVRGGAPHAPAAAGVPCAPCVESLSSPNKSRPSIHVWRP